MTKDSARSSNYDFLHATGEAILEWDSAELSRFKILNEMAFEAYSAAGIKRPSDLFTQISHESNLVSLNVGSGLIGEYFSNVWLGRNVTIGNNVNVVAHGGITIKDGAKVGDGVQLLTVFHSIHPSQRLPIRTSPIIIEEGANIESGALIVSSRKDGKPLIIGKNAHILANSVVVGNVAEGAVVGGRPARALDEKQAFQYQFTTATHDMGPLEKLETGPELKTKMGVATDVCAPIHVRGSENITNDGFYFVNRDSRLAIDGKMHVGKNTLFSPSVSVTVKEGGTLAVGTDVWVGAGAAITVEKGQNLTIGNGAIVAAGSKVTQDVAPMTVVTGLNAVKKYITDEDFDSSIPKQWLNPAYCMRSGDAIAQIKQEIWDSIESPRDLRDLIRTAHANLHAANARRFDNGKGFIPAEA